MLRKTKIVCTLGPSTDRPGVLRDLILSGMNVARFNFSHQEHAVHEKRLQEICKLREELKIPVATLLDTKGPEIRLGTFEHKEVLLKKGQEFTLYTNEHIGNEDGVSISYAGLPDDVEKGAIILIDDGLIEMKVTEKTKTSIRCIVINEGKVSDQKGVNIPGCNLSLPFVSEKDKNDIAFAAEKGFDFLATSFTRSAQDITEVREILNSYNCHTMKIIAKIENRQGIDNIEEILPLVDGIMVARGDMGVEIPFEQLPAIQKKLIKQTYQSGKIVITATQMLESMMQNPRPTRAETSDVANAIYDETSAVMLSGETAAGKWPVESCKTMVKIAEETERGTHYMRRFAWREIPPQQAYMNGMITSAISKATVTTAHELKANAILTVTKSGATAYAISKHHPIMPIIAGTTNPQVCRQMSLAWGVYPFLLEEKDDADDLFAHMMDSAQTHGFIKNGDLIVMTAGVPLGISGTTNMLKAVMVGNILLTGRGINHTGICGNLCVAKSEEEAMKNFQTGDILVISETNNRLIHLIQNCSGLIVEMDGMNSHAAIAALTLNKPVIIGAKKATSILKSGIMVKLDPENGTVSAL